MIKIIDINSNNIKGINSSQILIHFNKVREGRDLSSETSMTKTEALRDQIRIANNTTISDLDTYIAWVFFKILHS